MAALPSLRLLPARIQVQLQRKPATRARSTRASGRGERCAPAYRYALSPAALLRRADRDRAPSPPNDVVPRSCPRSTAAPLDFWGAPIPANAALPAPRRNAVRASATAANNGAAASAGPIGTDLFMPDDSYLVVVRPDLADHLFVFSSKHCFIIF